MTTPGEDWARAALADLRDDGPSASAVVTFLQASRRRARENRARRPDLAAQARRWSAAGAAAWALPPLRGRRTAGLAGWGLTALMLDWHLGMVESETGEPRRLGLADACTLGRAWLVPLAAAGPTAPVLVVGFGSDVLDGMLARATTPTRAGRDLEGAVDAAFSLAALRGATRRGRLSRGPAALEAARVAGGVAVAVAGYVAGGHRPPPNPARGVAPVRAAGLLVAALGGRRAADVLVTAGALLALSRARGRAAAPRR